MVIMDSILPDLKRLLISGNNASPLRSGLLVPYYAGRYTYLEKLIFRDSKKNNCSQSPEENAADSAVDALASTTCEATVDSVESQDQSDPAKDIPDLMSQLSVAEGGCPAAMEQTELFEVVGLIHTLIKDGKGLQVLDSLKCAVGLPIIHKETVVLCLASLAKQNINLEVVSKAYQAVPEVCTSGELLFLFFQLCKILSGKESGKGWGRGLKKAARNWYLHWEPKRLALEVTRCPQAYDWTHKDAVRMGHVSLKTLPVGTKVVLHYAALGGKKKALLEVKQMYGSDKEAADVLSVLEMLTLTPEVAADANLVRRRGEEIVRNFSSFSFRDVGCTMFKNIDAVVMQLVENGDPQSVLLLIRKMQCVDLMVKNSAFRDKLTARLKEAQMVSLNPLEVLLTYNAFRRKAMELVSAKDGTCKEKVWHNFQGPNPTKVTRVKTNRELPEGIGKIGDALSSLILRSCKNIPKTTRKGIVCIDVSNHMRNYFTSNPRGVIHKEMRGLQAVAVTLLVLASGEHFDSIIPLTFAITGLQKLQLPKPCPFHLISTKIKKIIPSAQKDIAGAINYAVENKLDTTVIIMDTVEPKHVEAAKVVLEKLKEKDSSVDLRVVLCACGTTLHVLESCNNPHLLVIPAFTHTTPSVIKAFHEREL